MGKANIDNKQIKSTIGFDLLVQDVMTKNVLSITKFESIMHVADILTEKNISGLPVVDKDNKVLGIITQADILSMIGVSTSRAQDGRPRRGHHDLPGAYDQTNCQCRGRGADHGRKKDQAVDRGRR